MQIHIVAGLTNVGVSSIAYRLAKEFGFFTVGIAPQQAFRFELFPVDEQHIVGNKFGEESEFFLRSISQLIRIGGGPQSMREIQMAREHPDIKNTITRIIEYNLPRTFVR